ncbi:hypothetical protein RB600_004013 [Gaeumannomyces tritici]
MTARSTAAGPRSPLDGFRIGSVTVPSRGDGLNCEHVAGMLTSLSAHEVDAGNPAMADIGLLTFLGVFGHQLPGPLGRATTGELLDWWRGSLESDRDAATAFLRGVTTTCMRDACSSTTGIGEADIAGIGMYVANTMLTLLVVMYWVFSLVHTPCPAHGRHGAAGTGTGGGWRHDCAGSVVCHALRATVDDVFDGALVYSTSLHVATLSHHATTTTSGGGGGGTTTRYEVTFAQTSCTLAALSSSAPPTSPPRSRAPPKRLEKLTRRGLFNKLRIAQSFFPTFGIFFYTFVVNAARSDFKDENKWGIGQYLAVASWLPSIIKLGYFLCVFVILDTLSAMETALTSHLPLPWTARLPPGYDRGSNENPLPSTPPH